MKISLGISNFLKEISSLSHSIVFLYFFALITEEGFLISPYYSLELCIQMGISFLFSFACCFSSFLTYLWDLFRQPFWVFAFLFLGDGLDHCMQVKKQQLELDMKQETGSKLWKKYVKAVYCHPAYLIFMLSTSWEMLDWMKHKLESRFPGEISIASDMQMTWPLWQKAKKN